MKRAKLFIVPALALFSNFAWATGKQTWWQDLYIGADAQVRRMDFKGGFGDNMLQHHSPQANLYAGWRFNSCFSLEAGYEATATRTRTVTLTKGDIATGTPIVDVTSPAVFKSKAKIKGPHIDAVGFWSPVENSPLQFMGAVGISILKGTFERQTLQIGNMAQNIVRSLSDHKSVLRLTGGVQYSLNQNWSMRATVGWVNTGRMVIMANDAAPSSTTDPEIKPKNSTFYGLGILRLF